MDGVEDFEPSCWGLIPVRVATVGGLVLVDLSGEAPDLAAHVGELAGHLDHYHVEGLARGGRATYEVEANWKSIAENYSECLHCPGVHPELNALSHYMSGEVMEGAGAWCGGSMTLSDGAATMAREGGTEHGRPPIEGLSGDDLGLGSLLRAVPELARLAPSRLRDAPHHVAAGTPTGQGWSASGSSSRPRWPPTGSTPRTRSTSGTR